MTAVGLLLSAAALTACSGGVGKADPQPVPPAQTKASPTVQGSSETAVAELGPSAFRVQTATLSSSGAAQIDLVGPPGAKLKLKVGASAPSSCRQTDGMNDAAAGAGLPSNSTQHYHLQCSPAKPAKSVVILVSMDLAEFTYDFQVPVTLT
jgi:hypothetical protein